MEVVLEHPWLSNESVKLQQLSTVRLRPIVHQAKNCILTLRDNGDVFLQSPHFIQTFIISKDGSEVHKFPLPRHAFFFVYIHFL